MNRALPAVLLLAALLAQPALAADPGARPELEYLKAVNRAGPPKDPQLLFLLMGQYASAGLPGEGAEFFAARLKEFEPRLGDIDRAHYLAAIGLLRAQHAAEVPFWSRIGWVKDTVAMLEEAKRKSGGEAFLPRWIAGVVAAQLPGFFGREDAARADLLWCLRNADKAPHPGWLREVYFQLASLERRAGNEGKAGEYLRASGYPGFDKPITLTTPFSEDPASGHRFAAKSIREVVPGRVYALSGFEFTEYYFVVSGDGRELIGIDAGTRPDSARAAYEALRAHAPGLPPLTAVLVTHAHWDHVGGHRYFRELAPRPKFYARANYREEIARELDGPGNLLKRFFGERFDPEDVRGFAADVMIEGPGERTIGGTRVEFIPVEGGETRDALLIHFPDLGVMFAGDFIMPYLGAPFVEEGSLAGLLDAIDAVAQRKPRHLLHGHEPLTRLFASASMLAPLKADLAWLNAEVLARIRRGEERSAIHAANLIPPGLLEGDPEVHLSYLVMRENVINRVYDQKIGYWQPDLQGLDSLGRADRGSLLVDYLDVSESRLAAAAERMIADGKYELAAQALDWTRDRFPGSATLSAAERLAYLKLMEKYQEFNPFKFIVYSGRAGLDPPPLEAGR